MVPGACSGKFSITTHSGSLENALFFARLAFEIGKGSQLIRIFSYPAYQSLIKISFAARVSLPQKTLKIGLQFYEDTDYF